MLDDAALEEARRAEALVGRLERELADAKQAYRASLRRLHLRGGSLREIASALSLSYQRVHQIVQESGSGWRSLLRVLARGRVEAAVRCSFCGRSAAEVARLIAGPHDHICGACVDAGRALAADDAAPDEAGPLSRLAKSSARRCSFCGKQARGRWTLVAGEHAQICNECLDYCETILAEHA